MSLLKKLELKAFLCHDINMGVIGEVKHIISVPNPMFDPLTI